jgi:hypothetical protein
MRVLAGDREQCTAELEQHPKHRLHHTERQLLRPQQFRWCCYAVWLRLRDRNVARPVRLTGTLTDITARRQAESALFRSQARRLACSKCDGRDHHLCADGGVIDFPTPPPNPFAARRRRRLNSRMTNLSCLNTWDPFVIELIHLLVRLAVAAWSTANRDRVHVSGADTSAQLS